MNQFGFIVLRHVSKIEHNKLWINCCKQIRKFYNEPIIIIDDNSDKTVLENVLFDNCQVIHSEFPGAGELLPYYYLYKYQLFEKCLVIHDSAFIVNRINFDDYNQPVHLLWTAPHRWNNISVETMLINNLKNSNILLDFYNNRDNWVLCFGVMSIVTYDYVKLIEDKYSFFNLVNVINNRTLRMGLERIFGILACYENYDFKMTALGDITNNYRFYNDKIKECLKDGLDIEIRTLDDSYKILKCWIGR